MKVLFLDIDGVLNDHKIHENGYCGFKSECVEFLNYVLHVIPDLRIVISSAWRYMVDPKAMTPLGFEYLLLVGGLDCKGRVAGFTVRDEILGTRGKQIKEYLQTNPIQQYAIVDDMMHDFNRFGLASHFVMTDGGKGLDRMGAEQIIKIFNK